MAGYPGDPEQGAGEAEQAAGAPGSTSAGPERPALREHPLVCGPWWYMFYQGILQQAR